MIGVAVSIVLLLIVQDFLCWLLLIFNFKNHHQHTSESSLPPISILVPARNEEMVIRGCLVALEQLDYPQDRVEFLVGNDHSTDNTGEILDHWVEKAINRKKVEIPAPSEAVQHLNGKAHALSVMIRQASGELYLFTDADCQVNPGWARVMVTSFRPEVGLVAGITKVRRGHSLLEICQGLDWWLTLGLLKVTSDLGNNLTAVGNNMLVSKEAYNKVGGYESLPFSVTEDFELGKAIAHQGYRPIHQVSPDSLVTTKAEGSLEALLKQRKRWMRGAMDLPLYWKALLFFQVLVFPALIVLICLLPFWGMVLWGVKVVVQAKFIQFFARRTGTVLPWFSLLFFEVYYIVISWSTIVYYFWPSKIHWKERKY